MKSFRKQEPFNLSFKVEIRKTARRKEKPMLKLNSWRLLKTEKYEKLNSLLIYVATNSLRIQSIMIFQTKVFFFRQWHMDHIRVINLHSTKRSVTKRSILISYNVLLSIAAQNNFHQYHRIECPFAESEVDRFINLVDETDKNLVMKTF